MRMLGVRVEVRVRDSRADLEWESDVGVELVPGVAHILEALDVQAQHLGQTVDSEALGGGGALLASLTVEALLSLQQRKRFRKLARKVSGRRVSGASTYLYNSSASNC